MNKQASIDLNLEVSSLITATGTWRAALINELFPPVDSARIMKLQIGNLVDGFIWPFTANGWPLAFVQRCWLLGWDQFLLVRRLKWR